MLIAIEGPDGCGKTTQVEMLRQYAERNGLTQAIRVESAISESPIGRYIRKALAGEEHVNALEMQALMTADRLARARSFEAAIGTTDSITVVDRWTMSAFVYGTLHIENEARAGKHPELRLTDLTSQSSHVKWLRRINHAVPAADLTIVISVSFETLKERLAGRPHKDIYEHDAFLSKLVSRYGNVQRHYADFLYDTTMPAKVLVVDGQQDAEDVHADICSNLARHYGLNPWLFKKGK